MKKILKIAFLTLVFVFFNSAFFTIKTFAKTSKSTHSKKLSTDIQNGSAIQFGTIDNLLWSIIATIQSYTLPIMAITIALLGVKLVTSGEDTATKESIKGWITKILIGGVLIFGASTIASVIKSAVGG